MLSTLLEILNFLATPSPLHSQKTSFCLACGLNKRSSTENNRCSNKNDRVWSCSVFGTICVCSAIMSPFSDYRGSPHFLRLAQLLSSLADSSHGPDLTEIKHEPQALALNFLQVEGLHHEKPKGKTHIKV